jgi:prevent-host-death family protein
MKIASVADVKAKFSAYLKDSEGGPVVVTRNGKPVAVLLGIQDEEEIERLLMAYSPRLSAILDRSREQIRRGESMGHAEFWSDLGSEGERTRNRRRPSKGKASE